MLTTYCKQGQKMPKNANVICERPLKSQAVDPSTIHST